MFLNRDFIKSIVFSRGLELQLKIGIHILSCYIEHKRFSPVTLRPASLNAYTFAAHVIAYAKQLLKVACPFIKNNFYLKRLEYTPSLLSYELT